MKIAIDARLLQGKFTGDRTYWRGLIRGLSRLNSDDEYVLYTYPSMSDVDSSEACGLAVRPVPAMSWRSWSLWAFPRALGKDGVDVAHVQYSIPPFAPCPVITSVHDISFKTCSQYFRFKDRFLLDRGFRYGARYAVRVLALSEYTKREIIDYYGVAPEKIEVVYPGVDEQFRLLDKAGSKALVREKYSVDKPFVITVGVVPARKNIPRLLRAFAQSRKALASEHKLVIVGKPGAEEKSLSDLAETLGLSEDVIFAGYVPQEDLPSLYSAADLCVYPSLYEGFGLPALEAMACGVPVITGNRSSLPEAVGDAGITVDPVDCGALADAISSVLSSVSRQAEMSAKGLDRAGKFSWDDTARRVAALYREVAR